MLESNDIIKVDILVSPLEVVDDPLVSQLLLHNEQILEELHNTLVDIEVVKFSNHRLLILQVLLIRVDQSVALVNDRSEVLEDLGVKLLLQTLEGVVHRLVLTLLSLQLVVHGLDLIIVAFEFTEDHLFVRALLELGFDLVEVLLDLWELLRISF